MVYNKANPTKKIGNVVIKKRGDIMAIVDSGCMDDCDCCMKNSHDVIYDLKIKNDKYN